MVITEIDEKQGKKVVKEADAPGSGRVILIKTDVGWMRNLFFWGKPMEDWERGAKLNCCGLKIEGGRKMPEVKAVDFQHFPPSEKFVSAWDRGMVN